MDTSDNIDNKLLWLRAAIMGANDGILSTSSMLMGMITTNNSHDTIILAGISALIAGAMAMAAGEYVSVSSEKDSEDSIIEREFESISHNWEDELKELTKIYISRGLDEELAKEVASEMMKNNALEAHTRDEFGLVDEKRSNPIIAAIASAISFSLGAIIPILVTIFSNYHNIKVNLIIGTLLSLIILGFAGAKIGKSNIKKSITRIVIWGILSLLMTNSLQFIL